MPSIVRLILEAGGRYEVVQPKRSISHLLILSDWPRRFAARQERPSSNFSRLPFSFDSAWIITL